MNIRIYLLGNAHWVGEIADLDQLLEDVRKAVKSDNMVKIESPNQTPVYINPEHILSIAEFVPPVEVQQPHKETTIDVS